MPAGALLLRGVKRFASLKAGSHPRPASALSNAIRFVGEKDEGGCRKGEKEAEGGEKGEKLLEVAVINTLNFFPAARRISRAARPLNANDRNRSLI